MKTPVKLIFVALPALVVGAVAWHLQHPSPVISAEGPCRSPSDASVGPGQEVGERCIQADISGENRFTGTRVTAIRLVQFDGEHARWRLDAPSAHTDSETRILVHGPDLTVYSQDGQPSMVRSAEGSLDGRSQAMQFTGNVVASREGQQLSTEALSYDPGAQTLHTDRPFVLVDREMQLEGVGLTLFQETQRLVVGARVLVRYFTAQDEVYREKDGSQPHI
ncbi:MAG: LPS export ABC transporter periplasmic protein LptC [Magnetococcus sp. MYC-9]